MIRYEDTRPHCGGNSSIVLEKNSDIVYIDGESWKISPNASLYPKVIEDDGKSWDISPNVNLYPKSNNDYDHRVVKATEKKITVTASDYTERRLRPPDGMLCEKKKYMEQNNRIILSNPESLTTVSDFPSSDEDVSDYGPEDEDVLMVEVAPGVEVQLRGSSETRSSIKKWQIAQVTCLECCVQLYCIDDAEYVLCPMCRCVSPLALLCSNFNAEIAYGVGLGFQSCPKSNKRTSRKDHSH
mmetsp:Transcript_27320/g.31187  ORF Transcript_27320/g.31187 Transcript_27320/m.31187 type:complete len:241 (+) Transcript_27320:87-809(+)|eukprot:CAMPEP_0194151462 /NCGR_PEP_ID=MMETSP0152-20130528/48187_1 /TAXON_ID=1049557 /ORGANISM="Thalassiothrix antarctica, Strain L6-D1" /LENGTH=240 /DNA_ID=CAMNT_0038855275 /DNA_START=110 /DNA_END=832 /DNA_ORIENTATION=-